MLDDIDDPVTRTRAFSALTRINMLYMVARAGSGHLGSSLSAADMVSWLLLHELRRPCTDTGDLYFSSKGHDAPGLYAVLIGPGALDAGPRCTGCAASDGLPGHPDVAHAAHVRPTPARSGMGISKAKGFVAADRLRTAPARLRA